jgi:formylglycine-generating enzyme required for sulfatase activity
VNDPKDKPTPLPEDDWGMTRPNIRLPQQQSQTPQTPSVPPQDDFGMTTPNFRLNQNQPSVPSLPQDDFGMTAPNMRFPQSSSPSAPNTPSNLPPDDFGMTTPNMRLPQNSAPNIPNTPSNLPQDDFGMTTPNMRLPQTPRSSPPPMAPQDDFGMTTPNLNLPRTGSGAPPSTPSTGGEVDWGMTQNIRSGGQREVPGDFTTEGQGQDLGQTTPLLRLPNRPQTVDPNQATGKLRTPPGQPIPDSASKKPEPKPAETKPKSRLGLWLGLAGGALFFLLVAAMVGVYFLFFFNAGFTLIVRGAQPGSKVFVDNKELGVTAPDGTVKVFGLEAGKRTVKVTKEGFTDWSQPISGENGQTTEVTAQQQPSGAVTTKTDGLPKEIEFTGTMLLVGAGEFEMGSDKTVPEESPAHKVTLPDFYIDKFEVTNAQYKKFCDETGRTPPTDPYWEKGYFENRPNAPVVGVTYQDAFEYAKWAKKRLPTEAEWEKAASWDPATNTKRQYPWGDKFQSGKAAVNVGTPIKDFGKFPDGASAYGVMDMSGNVLEWVDSLYDPYPNSKAKNPAFSKGNRVVRGGHIASNPKDARTTSRIYSTETFSPKEEEERSWIIGFRCAVFASDANVQEKINSSK